MPVDRFEMGGYTSPPFTDEVDLKVPRSAGCFLQIDIVNRFF